MSIDMMRFKVVNKKWTAKFMTRKRFEKKYPGCRAITIIHKKQVVFCADDCVKEDIAHELTHAYMDELCAGDPVRLKRDQLEEHFAELISKHGETLIQQTKDIYNYYLSLKETV
jgi:hypothetical protein